MSNSTEERVIEKVRNVLKANLIIGNYVKGRVYSSHISSIEQPKYPAISIHLLSSREVFANPGMIEITLQIDSWLPDADFNMTDVMTIHRKLRENLQRQNLIDTTIGLKVAQCIELSSGPLLHEDDTGLLHYPAQFGLIAS